MRDPELSIAGWLLIDEAKTLRERAFARLIQSIAHDTIDFLHAPNQAFQIHPIDPTLDGLMYSCSCNTYCSDTLARIPISRAARSNLGDPELVPALQDLGNILAWEATRAFTDQYYPGVPDVSVPDEHVTAVMAAMQREMSREARDRQRPCTNYMGLPRERQRALAERRRLWYSRFGITPDSWQETGWKSEYHSNGVWERVPATPTWSLWDVEEIPMPDIKMQQEMLPIAF